MRCEAIFKLGVGLGLELGFELGIELGLGFRVKMRVMKTKNTNTRKRGEIPSCSQSNGKKNRK